MLGTLSKGIRPYILIIFLVLSLALFPALRLQPLDRDESRFMQATTQMFESHDFIDINFQNEPRNKKPVGIHWLQSLSVAATGGPQDRDPFDFRIVSIFGAILAGISTFLIGKKLFKPEVGLIASVALSTSLLLSTEAHIAKTDAALTGFTALAYYALAKMRKGENGFTTSLLFWFAFGMAFLIKGPVPLMIIGLSLIALKIWEKDAKWQKPIWDLRAIILFLAMVLPWFILIGLKSHWQFYIDAFSQDLAPKLNGHSENKAIPPGLHTLISPIILWPGSIFIGFALWAGIKKNQDSNVRFLLAWLIPAWIVFELSPGKLAHYTMPTHAAIFLLGTYGLFKNDYKGWPKWSGIILFVFASILISALPYLAVMKDQKELISNALVISSILLICSLATAMLASINSHNTAFMGIFTALLFSFMVKGIFLPSVTSLNVSGEISNKLQELGIHPRLSHNGKMPPLVGLGYQEPSLVFLTRTDSSLGSNGDPIKDAQIGSPAIVEDKSYNDFQSGLAAKGLKFVEKSLPIKGNNYSKGKSVLIRVGVIDKK